MRVLWTWVSHIHIEEALLPKHVHRTGVKKLFERIWTALPCCKYYICTMWKPYLTTALSSPNKREVIGIVEAGLGDILRDWVVDHVDDYGEKSRQLSMRRRGIYRCHEDVGRGRHDTRQKRFYYLALLLRTTIYWARVVHIRTRGTLTAKNVIAWRLNNPLGRSQKAITCR